MKGSIRKRKDTGWWVVDWYDPVKGREVQISRYKGERMWHRKQAEKLRSVMQSDVENGTFRIEKYTGKGWTDVIPYLREWLEAIKLTVSEATYHDYKNSVENHLVPFFKKQSFQLHEIQYDVLVMCMNSIKRKGKGKFNVMMALHACLRYAKRSRRIEVLPEFPEKRLYGIEKKPPVWLSSEDQERVIREIEPVHQPIFWFMKYHWRRPGEAMALHKEDYKPDRDCFVICRGISRRKVVQRTKTKAVHIIPCHYLFKPILEAMAPLTTEERFSPFLFTCASSRVAGKRYTDSILHRLWYGACDRAGVPRVKMYDGTKKSSASQFMNEIGGHRAELQAGGDWADIRSTEPYAQAELNVKREILERGARVVSIRRNYDKGGK